MAWLLDSSLGSKDAKRYTMGIKDTLSNSHTALNVRKESSTSSTVLYQTVKQSNYAFLLLDTGTKYNGFYKIQSDPVLNSSRSAINTSSGVYNFGTMYGYASADYITVVNQGNSNPGVTGLYKETDGNWYYQVNAQQRKKFSGPDIY